MAVNRIEALLDAIGKLNQIGVPESLAYKLRNPLLLRSYAKLGRHATNTDGLRVFSSLLAGLKAGVFDLQLKLKGLSRAGLRADDPLRNLLGCYGISSKQAQDGIVAFVRRALEDPAVTLDTPLSYFLVEDKNGR